jgi:hypothetical protein
VEPTELHEGKVADAVWFDEQRVELVESRHVKVSPQNKAKTGGPQKDPVR